MSLTEKPRYARVRRVELDRIRRVRLDRIHQAPENDSLYRFCGEDLKPLIKSIRRLGQKEPIVLSSDNYIISGHRRYLALVGLGRTTAKCRYENISHGADPERFMQRLRDYNLQRNKTLDEKVKEEIVTASGNGKRCAAVIRHKVHRSLEGLKDMEPMGLGDEKKRHKISKAKRPFLEAIKRAVYDLEKFWPLSDRKYHYELLNYKVYRNTNFKTLYRQDDDSYDDLTDMVVRGLLAGELPWEAFGDETRPVITWDIWADPSGFIHDQLDGFLDGYYRDLMQSQPNHIEIVCEKNTLVPIIKPVVADYTMPLTSGHGYSSIHPRKAMADRFKLSGKVRLIILAITDFDVDGEYIASSFGRSMRDDFDIEDLTVIKVALTHDQVLDLDLPPGSPVKRGKPRSPQRTKALAFEDRYGDETWEVEALSPEQLQEMLRNAIETVIDTDAFNHEVEQQHKEQKYLNKLRPKALAAIGQVIDEETEATP